MIHARLFLENTAMVHKSIFRSNTVMIVRRTMSMSVDLQDGTEREKFVGLLPNIVSSIVTSDRYQSLPQARDWIKKLITYNSNGGKKTRGMMTVRAYQMLENPDKITGESLHQARVLGWCVEFLQSCMLLLDDVIDQSTTRRAQPCWYTLPGVGMRALNDSMCLMSLVFDILKSNFREKLFYGRLVDVFNEAILQVSIGQHLDYSSARNYKVFMDKNYNNIAIFKTAYYTYKLPIYAGMLLANKSIDHVFKNTEDTLDQIGILTLMQNDFMDCYGEKTSGKAGTDIQEGKCSWLAVKALQRCNSEQRAVFMKNYGSADEACVQRVKNLYEHLQLPAVFSDAERTAYDDVVRRLEALPTDNAVPSAVVLALFNMIYRLWDTRQEPNV